jgi:hypothetical protein
LLAQEGVYSVDCKASESALAQHVVDELDLLFTE